MIVHALADGKRLTHGPAALKENEPTPASEEPTMRRPLAISICAFTSIVSVFAGTTQAGPIADKNLEAAIRAVLQEPKADLTDEKLNNVYILEADGKGIKDLTGLEKCKNLAQFKAAKNEISDLKALKDLTNLQYLDLANNKIIDIAALAGLVKLQYLELSNNQITKVKPLAGLGGALTSLYLGGNKITSIGPLGNLSKLSSLYLAHNQIEDISALWNITHLNVLDLKENKIDDIGPLSKQTELSILMIEKNQIDDLTPLLNGCKADAQGQKRFAPYLRLFLAGNPLSETAKKTQLEELKKIGVRVEG
jgi:Leucine-rich repeat (LRR) protein